MGNIVFFPNLGINYMFHILNFYQFFFGDLEFAILSKQIINNTLLTELKLVEA